MNRRDAIKALMVAIPATATLTEAKVEPDDVLIVECEHNVSDKEAERIYGHLNTVWPGRKAVIMGRGMHLKIAKHTS